MRAVLNRVAPLAVAALGVALVMLPALIDSRRSATQDDEMLYYSAVGMTAWWILGTSCAIGIGWQALRTRPRFWRAAAALVYVVIWAAKCRSSEFGRIVEERVVELEQRHAGEHRSGAAYRHGPMRSDGAYDLDAGERA